jgi:hypothetical protein
LVGGGLLVAVLFFAFTSLVNHSSSMRKATGKKANNQPQQTSSQSKGSVTPLMETVRNEVQENTSGQVRPGDIKRTSTPAPGAGESAGGGLPRKPRAGDKASANTLGAIPSFLDTQQKWEEPQPYGEANHAYAAIAECFEGSIAGICAPTNLVTDFKQSKSRNGGCSTGTGNDARGAD